MGWLFLFMVVLSASFPSLGRAESAPALSTAPASVIPSTAPPSVAVTGETVSAPPPRAMTQPSETAFLTLTRAAVPGDRLPTFTDSVFSQTPHASNAQNAGEAVACRVGVQVQPLGSLGAPLEARLRGAPAGDTLVLLDGRPVRGFALGAADLSEIPLEQVDRIEIVRGGLSALYGPSAVGGVINVVSKRAIYSGLPISHAGYEGGSYGRQGYRLDFGSRQGPVDFFFFGKQRWVSGFRDNSDARQYNLGGNVGVSMGAAGKLLFDLGSYNSRTGAPGQRCDTSDLFCQNGTPFLQPSRFNDKDEKPGSSPTARQVTDNNYVRTSYIVSLPKDSWLILRSFGMERQVEFETSTDTHTFNVGHTDRREQSKGADVQVLLPLGLLAGGNFVYDREDHKDLISSTSSFAKAAENWGVFAQATWRWRMWTLIPSGRYDHNSHTGSSSNPRVNAMADATPWLRFSGSAARSFRPPSLDELFFVGSSSRSSIPVFNGNPDLRPEKAWTYDVGFELHESSNSFSATYFHAKVIDLIHRAPITSDTVGNISQARRQGFEVQIHHVLNGQVSQGWNYAYLENRGMLPGHSGYVTLAFSPRHTANYRVTWQPTPSYRVDSSLRFLDSRFSGHHQTGTKMGSQLTWDLRLAYQLRQLELSIGSNNLVNKRSVEQPGFPLPGRTYYGGFALRLWG